MPSRKLVVGNWKMNPASAEEAKIIAKKTRSLAAKLERTDVVVCPPAAFLFAVGAKVLPPAYSIGAQSVSVHESGAHTGEMSVSMLESLGARHVICGHSEARAAGDSDETVSKRVLRVLEAGLTAIACVGEKAREESGAHFDFIKNQLKASLAGIAEKYAGKIVIAYEPVWAIGAQEAMDPEQVYEMSLFVKKAFADVFGPEAGLKAKVLYGGSVNARNAADIITIGKVDGLLVGRESVNMPGYTELLKAVDAIGAPQQK